MKKALSILITWIKNYIVYPADVFWVNIVLCFRIIIIVSLYKYIFSNNLIDFTKNTINELTFALIMAQVVSNAKPRIIDDICLDIKSWKISVYLLQPINYISLKFYQFFPVFIQNVIFWLIFWVSIGYFLVWGFKFSLNWIIFWSIFLLISMLLVFFSYTFIWLLAFYTEDIEAFRFIYWKLDMIFWGNILPLVFLPLAMQKIAYLSPFAYFGYTSWFVFTNFELQTFIKFVSVQGFWLLITIFSCILIYQNASKKLSINWW